MSSSRAPIQARLPRATSRPRSASRYIAWKIFEPAQAGHDREGRLEGRRLHRGRGEQARAPGRRGRRRRRATPTRRPVVDVRCPRPRPIAARNRTGDRNEREERRRGTSAGTAGSGARRPGRWPADRDAPSATSSPAYSTSERPVRRRKTSSSDDRRTRTLLGLRGRARGPRPRPPRRRRRRAGRGRAGARSARRGRRAGRRASPATPGAKRSSVTSRVEYCSMSSRGEPSATIFALSMTTSRSHSCSASSM